MDAARRFAAALDSCDYERATELLAVDCCYERPGKETLVGPGAICNSYHESDLKARRIFDHVIYRSEAAPDESGGIRLTFFDDLCCGGATHTFRCAQIVYFDEDQKIHRIELAEVPGERGRLEKFCSSRGIQLDN
jgi:hypothetical protein